jgi:hypothetical protein
MDSDNTLAYKSYSLAVQGVLVDYQFIEEGLRMYAALSYDLIRLRLGKDLPFKFEYADTEKDSLGKLVSRYEKLSSNITIMKELKELVPHRNQVAHQSFLHTTEQQRSAEYLDAQTKQLLELRTRTKSLVGALFGDVAKVETLIKAHRN